MYFLGAGQRERSRHFEALQTDTDRVLQIRYVGKMVGAAGTLRALNQKAFLPNIRVGRAVVPREYRSDEQAVAVMPVGSWGARAVGSAVAPLLAEFTEPRRIESDVQVRGLGGAVARKEVMAVLEAQGPQPWDVSQLDNPYGAAMLCGARLLHTGRRHQQQISRPVLVVHRHAIQTVPQRFMVGTHMFTHVTDALYMGAMYRLPENLQSSELYANHVTNNVADTVCLEVSDSVRTIEQLRQQHQQGDAHYVVAPPLLDGLQKAGVALPHC